MKSTSSSIRTVTVGTGIAPVLLSLADCNRRLGISPYPEDNNIIAQYFHSSTVQRFFRSNKKMRSFLAKKERIYPLKN
jgi:hypothetical protein